MTQTTQHSIHHLHSHGNGATGLPAWFSHFAQTVAMWSGHPTAFLLAVLVIVVWVVTGPIFNFSDTWQLIINTGTTIVTFLMVFLIQNTQNRDMMAIQLKLSELVLAMKGAKNEFAIIEDLSDDELQELHEEARGRVERLNQSLEQRRTRSSAGHANGGTNHRKRAASRRSKSSRQASQSTGK